MQQNNICQSTSIHLFFPHFLSNQSLPPIQDTKQKTSKQIRPNSQIQKPITKFSTFIEIQSKKLTGTSGQESTQPLSLFLSLSLSFSL